MCDASSAFGLLSALAALEAAPAAMVMPITRPVPRRNDRREISFSVRTRATTSLRVSWVVLIYLPPFAITAAAFWIAVRIRG